MENPRLLRLVALDESGRPVEMNEVHSVYFLETPEPSIHVEARHFKNIYNLKLDVLLCEINSVDAETDMGATLGRVALSGVAVGLLFRNKYNGFKGRAFGAALADYAARGVEFNEFYSIRFVFKDTTVIQMRMNATEWSNIESIIDDAVFSESHQTWALSYIDLVDRLCADGERALLELEEELREVNARVAATESLVESGETFQIRDSLRVKLVLIKEDREILLLKIKNVKWSLACRALDKSVNSIKIPIESTLRSRFGSIGNLKRIWLMVLVFFGGAAYLLVHSFIENRVTVNLLSSGNEKQIEQSANVNEPKEQQAEHYTTDQKVISSECSPNLTQVEKLICTDDVLSRMDRHLADVFDRARYKAKDDEDFLAEAEGSMKKLNECKNRDCVMIWMADRERHLLEYLE